MKSKMPISHQISKIPISNLVKSQIPIFSLGIPKSQIDLSGPYYYKAGIIVWQRFCEPARLRIAYCLSVRACLVWHLMLICWCLSFTLHFLATAAIAAIAAGAPKIEVFLHQLRRPTKYPASKWPPNSICLLSFDVDQILAFKNMFPLLQLVIIY